MNIIHLAPFTPHLAGIYEAARDMAVADIIQGHSVGFVDTGPFFENGEQRPPQVGAKDDRGGFEITTADPNVILQADVIIQHTGAPDIWTVRTQAPIIWIIHGRPLAAFRSEQKGGLGRSYQLLKELASWPRVKAMVYFWPEFKAYWDLWIPPEKTVCFEYPPIDEVRFSTEAPIHLSGNNYEEWCVNNRGKWNGLICDSWRDDVDIVEVTHGAIEAAKQNPGLKWHFYAMETQENGTLRTCWEVLLNVLREMGALGEVKARVKNMDEVYRGVDFVLTPHRIITRIIGEALSCGTPVVAADGCKATNYTADVSCPKSVAWAVGDLLKNLETAKKDALKTAENFSLRSYGERMSEIYERAMSESPV